MQECFCVDIHHIPDECTAKPLSGKNNPFGSLGVLQQAIRSERSSRCPSASFLQFRISPMSHNSGHLTHLCIPLTFFSFTITQLAHFLRSHEYLTRLQVIMNFAFVIARKPVKYNGISTALNLNLPSDAS